MGLNMKEPTNSIENTSSVMTPT